MAAVLVSVPHQGLAAGAASVPAIRAAFGSGHPDVNVAAPAEGKMPQTIDWNSPPPERVLLLNEPYPLMGTASSGLPVTFRVVGGPGVIRGGSITARSAGAITLIAEQPGDATYSSVSMSRTYNQGRLLLSKVGEWPVSAPAEARGVYVTNDVAYLAAYTGGLEILDVSDPTNPVGLGGYDSSGWAYDAAVVGGAVYLADYHGGVHILDVSSPPSLVRRGGYDTMGNAGAIRVVGNHAYIADRQGGLQILDISDPSRLVSVGSHSTGTAVLGLSVVGSLAYLGANEGGLWIVDVSDPATPVPLGHLAISGNSRGVEVVGNLAYVAALNSGVVIVDVTRPAAPVRIGGYNTAGQAYHVQLVGNRAYVADGTAGLLVLDVTNPVNPLPVATFRTDGRADDVQVVGDLVFVAASEQGLVVMEAMERVAQTLRFGSPSVITLDDSPVLLDATASSGLPVSIGLLSGPATLTGNQLRVTGTGEVVVRLEQAGNEQFLPVSLERTLSIEPSKDEELRLAFRRDPVTSAIVFSAPARPGLYFTLEAARDLDRFDPVAMSLGAPAPEWRIPLDPLESHLAYRLKGTSLLALADTDRDGIDDVYELEHRDFQDPINAADAAEPFEPGLSKLEEYRRRNDPDRPPVAPPANMRIGCDDTRYDGRDILVDGITLTVDCQHTFRSLIVTNGGMVVTSPSPTKPLYLAVTGDVVIATNSLVSVDGRGHGPDEGPGRGGRHESHGSGGGHGGWGGRGNWANAIIIDGGSTNGSLEQPLELGSGGGQPTGGWGGGAVRLQVGGTLRVDGTIRADGANLSDRAAANSGAGAGGSVWLEAATLTGGGLISANGGTNEAALRHSGGGGGGGGGRIAIHTPCPPDRAALTIAADGGDGGEAGEAGTIHFGAIHSGVEGVVLTSGPVLRIPAPASVDFQTLTNASAMIVFTERTNVTLSRSVAVNLAAPGEYTSAAALAAGLTHVPAGIPVNSHYVHVDTGHTQQAESEVMLEITLTFDSDILGVILLTDPLMASDDILGHPETVYPGTEMNLLRGLEIGEGIGRDGVVLHENRRSITITGNVRDWADQLRIVTDAYGECP